MELGIPALATTGIGGVVRAAAWQRLLEFLGFPDLHGRAMKGRGLLHKDGV